MVNFKWVIPENGLDTAPQEGELLDVVVNVHYVKVAEDGKYIATYAGVMKCQTPSSTDFTAYPDLTYEQVCGWLEQGVAPFVDEILLTNIENQKNPPIINLPLPWTNEN